MLVSSINTALSKSTVASPKQPKPVMNYQSGMQRFEYSKLDIDCCGERSLNTNGNKMNLFA